MNILKRNFSGVISLICMVIVVGYINYEYNEDREKNLGKTVYVSTNSGEVVSASNNSYVFNVGNLDINKISENIALIREKINDLNEQYIINYDFSSNTYNVYISKKSEEFLRRIINIKENCDINVNIIDIWK